MRINHENTPVKLGKMFNWASEIWKARKNFIGFRVFVLSWFRG
jgi:hypothetical protein